MTRVSFSEPILAEPEVRLGLEYLSGSVMLMQSELFSGMRDLRCSFQKARTVELELALDNKYSVICVNSHWRCLKNTRVKGCGALHSAVTF